MLNKRLRNFLENIEILYNNQFSFRPKNTVEAVRNLTMLLIILILGINVVD